MSDDRPRRPLFRLPARRHRVERDVSDELGFHLEMREAELRSQGLNADDARREALRQFGDLEDARRYCRDEDDRRIREDRRVEWVGDLWHDLRYAARQLRRAPLFAAAAVVTLALGIGANTAVFSAVDAMLLRPLAFRDVDRLVTIFQVDVERGDSARTITYGDYRDLRQPNDVFEDLAILTSWAPTLAGEQGPTILSGRRVSPSLFQVLGVLPALGRGFLPEEEEPGRGDVIVLSHGFWTSHFGADPTVIGRPIVLGGTAMTIVGVLPRDFVLPYPDPDADVWTPFAATPERIANRTLWNYWAIARLRPGVTPDRASTALETIAARLRAAYPASNAARTYAAQPLVEVVVGERERPMLLLFGAAGFVLLIACVNLVNLLMARQAGRSREFAVRVALGAGRSRLARQLVTESLLLATLGGVLGALLAWWAIGLISGIGWQEVAGLTGAKLNARLLVFCGALALLTGLACGLAPLAASSRRLSGALRADARAAVGGASRRLRDGLAAAQVALAFVLLVGAGLMLASISAAIDADQGFDRGNLLTFTVANSDRQYDTREKFIAFYDEVEQQLRAIPGVLEVGTALHLPLAGDRGATAWLTHEDRPLPSGSTPPEVRLGIVRPGYFAALGIPIERGRDFTVDDAHADGHVSIVSRALAERHFPGEDPIGKRIQLGPPGEDWHEIIGVVGDVRLGALVDAPEPIAYEHQGEHATDWMQVAVRTAGDPEAIVPAVRRTLVAIDPDVPLLDVMSMSERARRTMVDRRFVLTLLGTFAGLALLLATIGIYGVMAQGVAQRTREFGVRLALGATPRAILEQVLSRGAAIAAVGVAVGVLGALLLARVMESLLYGVRPTDARTLAVVAVLLGGTTLFASLLPARRATRVDPNVALRAD